MNQRLIRGFITCAALGTAIAAALPADIASASGAAVTQISSVSVNAADSAVIDIGTINSQFSTITVSASGTTVWCSNSPNPPCTSDPDGDNNYGFTPSAGTAPNLPTGALIGKVGVNGSWFVVGSSYTATSAVPADLYVAYNDDVFTDNSGRYTLTVTRVKPAA